MPDKDYQSNDTLGWKVIQKHAPFFSPGDLAATIDQLVAEERQKAVREEREWTYTTMKRHQAPAEWLELARRRYENSQRNKPSGEEMK